MCTSTEAEHDEMEPTMTMTDDREATTMNAPRSEPVKTGAEDQFLTGYDTSKYPPFAVTCDVVMLTVRNGALSVLLIQRGDHPFKGRWALPGGFVNIDESLDDAAARELAEETGLEPARAHLEQLGTYGSPNRDPRMRVVDVAYLALLPEAGTPRHGSDADDARFWRVDELSEDMLAFDHKQILADGLERARAKLEYSPLATKFTDEEFTLGELQGIYEAVWGVRMHRPNFRRKVLSVPGFVVPCDGVRKGPGAIGPNASLYRAGDATLLHPAFLRPERTVSDDEGPDQD